MLSSPDPSPAHVAYCVLLVADSPEAASTWCAPADVELHCCNPSDAVPQCSALAPDVVVVDVQGGVEWLAGLPALPAHLVLAVAPERSDEPVPGLEYDVLDSTLPATTRWQLVRAWAQGSRLQSALRHLRGAAEARAAFVTDLHHELRTPLNGIIGLSRLALNMDLNPRLREYLQGSWTAANHLATTLNLALEYARLEAGAPRVEDTPFDVRVCLDGAVRSLNYAAAERRVELMCHVTPAVPEKLRGDARLVHHLVVSLMEEAVRTSPPGQVVLRCDVPSVATRLRLTVPSGRDSWRLDLATRVAHLLGGALWVSDSSIHVQCPLRAADSLAPPAPPPELQGLTVLVVVQAALHRAYLMEALSHLGLRATAAESAEEALQALSGAGFSAVVADDHLAGMSGSQLSATVKSSTVYGRPTFVVLVSALPHESRPHLDALHVKPVLIPALAQLLVAGVTPGRGDEEPVSAPTLRILLVDDNPLNRVVAVNLLGSWKHSVTAASSGSEAIRMAQEEPFDLILMDIHMPGMDGFEATAAIRATEGVRRVPIIAVTASARPDDPDGLQHKGLDGWVSKPLVEGDLAAEIRRVTGRSSKTSEPAGPVSSQETVDENREPIDRAFLYRNLGTNSAVLKRICSLFLQMCPHQMRDIREAVQSQDWLTVQRATHKVRGSVGTFAANAAVQAAHRLEAAARVPDAAGVQTCLVDLDREVERLVPAVTQLLAEVSASL